MKGIIILSNIFILSLFIICYPIICASQSFQEIIIINHKVGPAIDSLERKQYDLFPEYSDEVFGAAQFVKKPNNTIELLIYLKCGDIERQVITQKEYKQLKNNINKAIVSNSSFTERQIKHIKKEWDRVRINTTIYDNLGLAYEGQLLFANDSILFLYNSKDFYQPNLCISHSQSFHPTDIQRITINRKNGFLLGAGRGGLFVIPSWIYYLVYNMDAWGTLLVVGTPIVLHSTMLISGLSGSAKNINIDYTINGSPEMYQEIMLVLNQSSLFPDVPPPELNKALFDSVNKDVKLENAVAKTTDHPDSDSVFFEDQTKKLKGFKSPLYVSKFHISYHTGIFFINAEKDIIDALNNSGFSDNEGSHRSVRPINISINFSITDNIRLGIEENYYRDGYSKTFSGSSATESFRKTSFALVADYMFKPVNRTLANKWEFSAGCGFTTNKCIIDTHIGIDYFAESFEFEERKYGLQLRSGIEYFPIQSFSIQFKVLGNWIPDISVPSLGVTNTDTNETITFESHNVSLSSVELLLGVRIHL